MKILVPVDFHKASFAAYNYAANLSKEMPAAKVTLLHVINGTFNTNELVAYDPLKEMQTAAMERLRYFHEEYPAELDVTVPEVKLDTAVRFGIPGFVITDYAEQHDYDMIVMATRDKHGIFDRLMGSASALVTRQAKCPVILVHESSKYTKPSKILFAFDKKSDIEDALEDYKRINNILGASTHFLHVKNDKEDNVKDRQAELVEELLSGEAPAFSFEVKTVYGDDVHSALKGYCIIQDVDMVAMVHRKEGIFTSLFRKQNSLKMAQEFVLPVIVFQEED